MCEEVSGLFKESWLTCDCAFYRHIVRVHVCVFTLGTVYLCAAVLRGLLVVLGGRGACSDVSLFTCS